MTISIKPLNDQIWVLPLNMDGSPYKDEFLSVEGGLLTWSASKGPTKGIVIDIGPGKYNEFNKLIPMPDIKTGDIIRWSDGSALRFILDKQKIYTIISSAIIGIEI